MRLYEAMIIVDDGRCAEDYDAVTEHIQGILRKSNADVKKFSKWDSRRLAYPIGRHNRGVYLLVYFMAEPDAMTQINRDLTLSETVVRSLITVPLRDTERRILHPEEFIEEEAPAEEGDAPAAEGDAPAKTEGETPEKAKTDAPEGEEKAEEPADDKPAEEAAPETEEAAPEAAPETEEEKTENAPEKADEQAEEKTDD